MLPHRVVACKLRFALLAVIAMLLAVPARDVLAQAAPHDPVGTWQGTLHAPGHDLRTVLKITKGASGALAAEFFSVDQGGQSLPVSGVRFADDTLRVDMSLIDVVYQGKLSADGSTISGTSTQGGNSLPLNFERATAATAWEIPKPPPPLKAMLTDANPTFDAATVKPSKPDQPGKMIRVEGRRFSTGNTTVGDLIDFAYEIHPKQLVNAPAWVTVDKFDIAGTPDIDGAPDDKQWKGMVQKLLAERFSLKFHKDTRELSAYSLTAGKSGPKLEASKGDPNGLPGLFFTQPGNLHVMNANMDDFSHVMQDGVLDRPVVDRTGLKGRWNFNLKWTPDETQFVGSGFKITPPKEGEDAPPPLFTAIQEEIGLKLDATRLQVPVLVVDRLEKPSDN